MENPLLVFISSVIDDMAAERQAAETAIQAIPVSRPWLFEHSPASSRPLAESYLAQVRACDIFVLLLKDTVTGPVKLEVNAAAEAGKPRLVFVWHGAPGDVLDYARSPEWKYAEYQDPADLARKVAEAVGDELITGYRRHGLPRSALGGIGDFLDGLAAGAVQIDTGGGAVVAGGVQTGGDFIGRDLNIILARSAADILRSVRTPLSQEALQRATAAYYSALLDRHRYLNMKGMGVSDRVPLRIPLLDLYVPLKARLEMPEGDTWRRDLRLAGRALPGEEQGALAARLSEPRPVLELLQSSDGLIILGDPGAGKTTFLKFLALRMALGEGGALGLGVRLPVLLPLSAYANALGQHDALRLDDFMAEHLHDSGADLPMTEMLGAALKSGAALILLDGLDEVKDLALRNHVVERVADFYSFHRRAGNKFVLTSRIVGYRGVRPSAEGLAECTLVDFDADEITAFVTRWTAALERQAQGEGVAIQAEGERERRELLAAIERNASVRRLAANPLLLTILALMKRQGVTLPERRVQLYDQYIRVLLAVWNRARGLGRPPSRDLDEVETMRVLAPLALWMHEANPGAGLVKRADLQRQLAALYAGRGDPNPGAAAGRLLADVREYAGLLLERGPEEYGFIHLTFEEYLAAVAIALRGQGDCRPIVDALKSHVGDPAWREVALLTVGYLGIIQQLDRVAGDVVEALAKEGPGRAGEAAVLAGEAVLDAGPAGVPPASRDRVVECLVATMQDAGVEPALRRRAGLLLGWLRWQPGDLDDFMPVPAGAFLYGDDRQVVDLPHHYWIGKYPVTNAQYSRFMKDHGYDRRELWTAEGWAWRTGTYDSTAAESYEKDWLARRPAELRGRPYWWDDDELGNPICPVVGVSWFEAQAYARWLNTQPALLAPGATLPAGYCVRLPDEEEWERAARGAIGREYPWGDDFNLACCNTRESAAESEFGMYTTAVCTYPQGASPSGTWDMAGNVWEWTNSAHEDGRSRVVRGGSWLSDQGIAHCSVRGRYVPGNDDDGFGFRVVVSLSDAGF